MIQLIAVKMGRNLESFSTEYGIYLGSPGVFKSTSSWNGKKLGADIMASLPSPIVISYSEFMF
jgi:hypothetical protein